MHRATPVATYLRSYSAGGARSLVDKVDDDKQMQEMAGNFMKGETRDKVESPQNYGFTSVVMPATKDKDGKITESAEAFISFIGGSRSFPVAGVMDDRRYRLKELKPGDVAFYDHQQQQMHFNEEGAFLTGLKEKKIRLQLAEGEQSGGGGQASPSVAALAGETPANGGGSAPAGGQKKTGQKSRYKKESKQYHDIGKDLTDQMNKKHRITLDDEDTMVIIKKEGGEGRVYLGGDPDKGHLFAKVVTTAGPSKNVYARLP